MFKGSNNRWELKKRKKIQIQNLEMITIFFLMHINENRTNLRSILPRDPKSEIIILKMKDNLD